MKHYIALATRYYILWILTILSPLYSTITGLPVGAKYIALGGQVSLVEDVYSVYYNPACVDYTTQHQLAAEYTGMFVGLPENISRAFLGYVLPTKKVGSLGFCWTSLNTAGLYSENTVAVVYSKQKLLSYLPQLSAGIRAKFYHISYGKLDGVYDNNGWWSLGTDSALKDKSSKLALSLDLGFSYKLAQNYVLGLYINDVNQPNISLFDSPDVVVPLKIVFGIANINPVYGLNLDISFKDKDFVGAAGVQYKLSKKLTLYGSGKFTLRSYTDKTVSLIEPSFGIEFSFDGFNISYAFNYPLSGLDVFGNHTMSVTYKFGPVIKLPEDTAVLYAKIDSLEKQLKQKDAEIEELKKKLDELLKKPLPVEKPTKEKVAPPPTPTPIPPAKPPEEKKELTPKEQYESLFNRYLEMKEQLPFVERIKTVETIIKQFKDKTDVTAAKKELDALLKQQKQIETEVQTSKSYYYKLKSSGADKKTLTDLLNRIKKKYTGYGVDLNWVEEELKQLK